MVNIGKHTYMPDYDMGHVLVHQRLKRWPMKACRQTLASTLAWRFEFTTSNLLQTWAPCDWLLDWYSPVSMRTTNHTYPQRILLLQGNYLRLAHIWSLPTRQSLTHETQPGPCHTKTRAVRYRNAGEFPCYQDPQGGYWVTEYLGRTCLLLGVVKLCSVDDLCPMFRDLIRSHWWVGCNHFYTAQGSDEWSPTNLKIVGEGSYFSSFCFFSGEIGDFASSF